MERKPRREEGMKKYKESKNYKTLIKENDHSLDQTVELASHGASLSKRISVVNTTPEEFDEEVNGFIRYCRDNLIVPTMSGLALWLGVSGGTLNTWRRDPSHLFNSSIQKANDIFHNIVERKTLDGELNPVLFMFLGKNHWGYSDTTEVVHKSQSTQVIDITEQQRILRSTPGVIDAEFSEKDTKVPAIAERSGDLDSDSLADLLRGKETCFDEEL